jgi:hypothetical protein
MLSELETAWLTAVWKAIIEDWQDTENQTDNHKVSGSLDWKLDIYGIHDRYSFKVYMTSSWWNDDIMQGIIKNNMWNYTSLLMSG